MINFNFFMYFCYQVVKSLVNLSSSVMEMNSTLLIAAQRMEQACSRYANSSESCAHLLVHILLLLLQVSLISFVMQFVLLYLSLCLLLSSPNFNDHNYIFSVPMTE